MMVKFKKVRDGAVIPKPIEGDAGMDVHCVEYTTILPGDWGLFRTGLVPELPKNTEIQIRPRSGLALKHGITVLNSPGTIDEGYRGEIGIILINHGRVPFEAKPGDRIAQMVIKPVIGFEDLQIQEVDEVSNTSRGSGGFGHTGGISG